MCHMICIFFLTFEMMCWISPYSIQFDLHSLQTRLFIHPEGLKHNHKQNLDGVQTWGGAPPPLKSFDAALYFNLIYLIPEILSR